MSAVLEQVGERAAKATRGSFYVASALRTQILGIAENKGRIQFHSEKPWASITFSGSRHTLRLVFEGPDEVPAGEKLIAELAGHEFSIAGQKVCDANIVQADHRLAYPMLVVTISLLLLEDA